VEILCSVQDKDLISEQQIVLRQLQAILHIYKLTRAGQTVEVLRETIKLPFLHLDPQSPNVSVDVFRNLSPHVQACVPDLLKLALNCMDNVRDTDGTLRAVKSKVFHSFITFVSRYISLKQRMNVFLLA
jgi:nuclear pore complex protein Nup93